MYISGAAAEYEPDGKEAYEEFISKLSGLLIHKGFKIVSGYGLGVGSAVISGALSEIYHNQKKSLTDQLILRPFPQGDDAKAMWEAYRQDMISYSGISIFCWVIRRKMELLFYLMECGQNMKFQKNRAIS